MKSKNVTMTDASLHSLVKRCQEKEAEGYDYVTPIKRYSNSSNSYANTYAGQFNVDGVNFDNKYKVIMKKVD